MMTHSSASNRNIDCAMIASCISPAPPVLATDYFASGGAQHAEVLPSNDNVSVPPQESPRLSTRFSYDARRKPSKKRCGR
jgi:hypothetical protein